jgi:hypothetical protein
MNSLFPQISQKEKKYDSLIHIIERAFNPGIWTVWWGNMQYIITLFNDALSTEEFI